jgi:hypothetical protein
MPATDGVSGISLPRDALRGWPVRQALAASIVIALALGAFLAVRRCSGALHAALPPLQLVTAATLLLAWALAVRAAVRGRWAGWLPAGVLLLFAVACSFPGERAVDWLVWLTVSGAFVASHNVLAIAPARRSSPAAETDRVLQQLTRSRSAEGRDVIHGTLLAEFASGERIAVLYVAFCPPFQRLPRLELESTAEAKLVQTLHNGAQIEVRLPRAAKTATSATVELYATDAE